MPIEALGRIIRGERKELCLITGKERVVRKTAVGYSCQETACEHNGQESGIPLVETPTFARGRGNNVWICDESRGRRLAYILPR